MAMLIKQHAMELAPEGITVNGVAPTFVYTEMIRHVMENPAFRSQLLKRIPLGRIADPKDVVGAVLFFCSEASGFVTGQTLYVDGRGDGEPVTQEACSHVRDFRGASADRHSCASSRPSTLRRAGLPLRRTNGHPAGAHPGSNGHRQGVCFPTCQIFNPGRSQPGT